MEKDNGMRVGHQAHNTAASPDAARRNSPVRFASAALLTDEQAAREVLGISPRTFAEVMKESWMPRPIQLGPRLRRWSRLELEAAIQNAPRQAEPASEPAQLRRAKIDRMKAGQR